MIVIVLKMKKATKNLPEFKIPSDKILSKIPTDGTQFPVVIKCTISVPKLAQYLTGNL